MKMESIEIEQQNSQSTLKQQKIKDQEQNSILVNEFRSMLQKKDSLRNFQAYLQHSQDGLLSNVFHRSQKNPDEVIYELFKLPNKQEASIGKLLTVLKSYGLHAKSDPRLQPMMERIWAIEKLSEEQDKEAKDPKHWKLSKEDFRKAVTESLTLISRTLQNNLIVPSWGYFCGIIKEIYEMCTKIQEGKVATYIPQLGRVDPNKWGVAICTIDGQRFALGDSKEGFCLQSVSKAFNYAIAATELGANAIHQYIGQEPSGRLFNEICLDTKNRPHNPMVNSGAIVVTTLIQNKLNLADRFDYILKEYRKISGGQFVGFNNAVFLSERGSSDRNFALAYYMKEYKCFPPECRSLKEALDFYFQLCALEANCESAAVMAATLANGGVCPLTEERCIQSCPCRDVLSLMYSCGMYDYSGQFAFHVGLPAKSGVSGAMVVVVPNLMGICLWSPALDAMGNSCRGVAFCKEMIKRFNFHNYDSLAHTESSKFDPRKRVGEMERNQVVSLFFAAKAGDLNTIRRICMQSGDLELCDYDKRTALHLAAAEGHIELVKFLINIGHVEVEPLDRWNRTPRDDADTFGFKEIVTLLEKAKERKMMDQKDRYKKWRQQHRPHEFINSSGKENDGSLSSETEESSTTEGFDQLEGNGIKQIKLTKKDDGMDEKDEGLKFRIGDENGENGNHRFGHNRRKISHHRNENVTSGIERRGSPIKDPKQQQKI